VPYDDGVSRGSISRFPDASERARHSASRLATLPLLAVAALILGTIFLPTAAIAAGTPWGTGCMPAPAGTIRTSADCGAELVDGRAVAPPNAPPIVKRVIAAANHINGRPYVWGGGHRSFESKGYDCSGAVSYALHAAGLLSTTMVSGQLAYWGEPGVGRWITVYANNEHVFMVVAGLRFDTRDDWPGVSGPRWKMAAPDARILPHFTARHPTGL
jgi:cell wall-associated NlpC family hydrolase